MYVNRNFSTLLGNLLAGKAVIRAGKYIVRAGTGFNNIHHMDKEFFVLFHYLSNTEIAKYFNYERRFNGFVQEKTCLE